jgi:hypothetical protein
VASNTCSAATTSKTTQGASTTTPWPITAIASLSTSAELTAALSELNNQLEVSEVINCMLFLFVNLIYKLLNAISI